MSAPPAALPPLQPPEVGEDAETLHAALYVGLRVPPRTGRPRVASAAEAAARKATYDADLRRLAARLRQEPAFVRAAAWQVRRLYSSLGLPVAAALWEDEVATWLVWLLSGGIGQTAWHLPPQHALCRAVAQRWGLPWRPPPPTNWEAFAYWQRHTPEPLRSLQAQVHRAAWWHGLTFAGEDAGLEPLVAVLYADTQAWLATHGVQRAALWRGVRAPGPAGLAVVDPQLRPLSPFSTCWAQARLYARGAPAQLMWAAVPAARIFATCRTGTVGLDEAEVVLLGGETDAVWAWTWTEAAAAPPDETAYVQAVACQAPMARADAAEAALLAQAGGRGR